MKEVRLKELWRNRMDMNENNITTVDRSNIPELTGKCCDEVFRKVGIAVQNGLDLMEDAYVRSFSAIGWVPSVAMALMTMDRIKDLHNNGETERARKLMCRFSLQVYNQEMVEETFKSWQENQILSNRLHILEEAIKAHNNGMYFASVILFISQIEGLIYEVTNHKGWAKQEIVKDAFGDKDKFYIFADSLRKFAEKFLYEHFTWGKDYESPVNRHAIMHGRDIKFGTKENSIKIFMFIDLVQFVLGITKDK